MDAGGNGASSDIRPIHPAPQPYDQPPFTPAPGKADHGFGGTFITDDAVLEGSLEFQGRRLVMWGGGAPLLAWDPGECLLERLTANRFVLSADGETITFTADDPEELESAQHFHLYGQTPYAAPTRERSPVPTPPITSYETAHLADQLQADSFLAEPIEPENLESGSIASGSESGAAYPWKPIEELPPFEPSTEASTPERPGPFSLVTTAPDPEPMREPEPPPAPVAPEPEPSFGVRRVKAVRPLRPVEEPEDSRGEPETEPVAHPEPSAGVISEPFIDDFEEDDEAPTIADSAISRARRATTVRAARWWTTDVQTAAIKVAVVSGVVVVVIGFAFGVVLVMGGFQTTAAEVTASSPTTSIVTVPTTAPATVVTPSTVPLTTSVFELSGPDFAERWNVLASDLDENLLLSPNLTNPFSLVLNPFITFDGVLDPGQGSLRLRAAPTGTAEGDRSILVALALVIGTAEPSLTPANRGQLLEALGLDPSDPQLGGINAIRSYNGRTYELIYLDPEGILQFTVQPEAAPPSP